MSGNNYTVTCNHCKTVNTVRGKAMTLAMTCSGCGYYFRLGSWNDAASVSFITKEEPAIPVGAKGRFDGVIYEVMGFVVKQETKYHYSWREYLLFNPYEGYAFLSEYNGHWNFIWPIEENPRPIGGLRDYEVDYDELQYRIFQKYNATVQYARGEFFFDVVDMTDATFNREYIAPPFLLAVEESSDSVLWCKGEYCTRKEIAAAFNIPVSKLPGKKGRGYIQPMSTSFKDESLITLSLFLLIVVALAQIILSHSLEETVVFNGDFDQKAMNDQKMLVSNSFDVNGSMGNLQFELYAPLTNDWFYADFSLISETTGVEYNFSKDIEYYSGIEDGESWSEGSTKGTALISQIPGGRYHVNIYPEFSTSYQTFSMKVTRNVSMFFNFWITILLLMIFPIYYFIRKRMVEVNRWSESDYSPYYSE
ncbi:MAG TPA: DUF4178 domain-containing protein [Ohtaekwangia sp.]|uniref:DUF4178 domain-containing protein n=1 Tax=Ohtaekwangia sp. TaxID=2066019 RepID=UPI002F93AB33